MRVSWLTGVAVAAPVSLALAGCGGSGHHAHGIAAETPNQIIAAATRAIDGVRTVRVSGEVGDGSSSNTIKLDLNLVNGRGATGSMSEHGLSFKLISVGGDAYINGSPGFWKQFGGAAAVRQLQGKWLRAPADSGDFASFSSLTNVHKLLTGLLSGHGALTMGTTGTVDGQKVISVRDASRQGTLYVAATGPPYPIRIANTSTQGGEINFSRFNRPVKLKAPGASIDIDSVSH
jgi:hypothetical protein